MKYEYSANYIANRRSNKSVECLKRMIDSDYPTPIFYVRRYKENLVILKESEYKSLKEIEKEIKRIDTCLRLAIGSSVSCFNYKGKTIACMSVEKYNDLLSRALKNKENK